MKVCAQKKLGLSVLSFLILFLVFNSDTMATGPDASPSRGTKISSICQKWASKLGTNLRRLISNTHQVDSKDGMIAMMRSYNKGSQRTDYLIHLNDRLFAYFVDETKREHWIEFIRNRHFYSPDGKNIAQRPSGVHKLYPAFEENPPSTVVSWDKDEPINPPFLRRNSWNGDNPFGKHLEFTRQLSGNNHSSRYFVSRVLLNSNLFRAVEIEQADIPFSRAIDVAVPLYFSDHGIKHLGPSELALIQLYRNGEVAEHLDEGSRNTTFIQGPEVWHLLDPFECYKNAKSRAARTRTIGTQLSPRIQIKN